MCSGLSLHVDHLVDLSCFFVLCEGEVLARANLLTFHSNEFISSFVASSPSLQFYDIMYVVLEKVGLPLGFLRQHKLHMWLLPSLVGRLTKSHGIIFISLIL